MEGGCNPRRLVDWPILLKAAPRTHDSEDDMPSLSKESGQSPIPSTYLLSLSGHPQQPTVCLPLDNMLLSTGLSCRCVNTVTWRHSLPRIRLRGCRSEDHTRLLLQCLPPQTKARILLLWLHHHLAFEGSPGTSSIIHDFTSSKICVFGLD